jgi:putative iron-dependent peroxidase
MSMPATQNDVWALVPGPDAGAVFEVAQDLRLWLAPVAQLVEATPMFSYRQGRDLSGYKDGSENPTGDAAWAAALLPDGPHRGGSFVLVQRYLHFLDRMGARPEAERDRIVGRRRADDEEIDDAPASAHVKRTAQEDFEPPGFMLRRSMPWGDPRRHGLVFIAYMDDLGKADRMLARMMGFEDGVQDALLEHSQAETGGYYFVPPQQAARLRLPAAPAATGQAGVGAADACNPPVIRLIENGPLETTGKFCLAGVTQKAGTRWCRCGASTTQPYCDSRHTRRGFVAAGDLDTIDEPQVDVATAGVAVQPIADGPLVIGPGAELQSSDGRPITRPAGLTLCRCGQSAHKPFCDGSHARASYRAGD